MKTLYVLIIEDLEDDALLILRELKKGGFDPVYRLVENREDMIDAMKDDRLELILCDYQLPQFNAKEALCIYKECGKDIPFIVISGAVGEEIAVELMKSGAHDYVMKHNLIRLVPAIKRELGDAIVRRERRRADSEIIRLNEELEIRVEERTFLFKETNQKLKDEIAMRRSAQDELCRTEHLMDTIFNNIPDFVFLKDAVSLEYKFTNKSCKTFIGKEADSIIGKSDFDIFPESTAKILINLDKTAFETGETVEALNQIIEFNNSPSKLCNIKKIPVIDNDKTVYILGIIEDVTQRISTEQELRKSEIRFAKIFHSSPIPIFIYKMPEMSIIDANAKFFELMGYEPSEVFDKEISDEAIWVDKADRDSIIEQTMYYGNLQSREVRLRNKKDNILTVLFSAEHIKFDTVSLLIFMGLDISERKAADAELVNALEKQTELNRLKSQFVSMISHEFRSPLTTIMLSTDLLKRFGDRWTLEERNKHFGRIQDTILKMTQLMENVLLISKIESGGFLINPESIDLFSYCQSIAETIEFNSNSKNRIYVNSIGACEQAIVDESLIGLMITNLLTNAIKYSPEGSPVNLTIDCSDNNIQIKIQDYGIGIPAKDLQHLFQSFYRASNSESVSGYGLGLSIVKKCVNAHNGEISVESALGEGTTFTVNIPVMV